MFHKVENVVALPNYQLRVMFSEGVTKNYDVTPLFERFPAFAVLQGTEEFSGVAVDTGGYGIVWNDDLDLSCDELWEHGIAMENSVQ